MPRPNGLPDTTFQDLDGAGDEDLIEVGTLPSDSPAPKLDDLAPPVVGGDDLEVEIVDEGAPTIEDDEIPGEGEGDEPAPADDEPITGHDSFRKRLQREIRAKMRAYEELDEARAKAEQAEAELQKYREQNVAAEADSAIAAAKAKYAKARTDGDVEAEAEALAEMSTASARKAAASNRPAPAKRPNPAQEAWYRRNGAWFDKAGYDNQSAAAENISKELIAERLDPYSTAFYAELDKRLAKTVKIPRTQPATRPAASPAPARGNSLTPAPRKNVIQLDRSDLAMMRKVGLDPANVEHRKRYAREKAAER